MVYIPAFLKSKCRNLRPECSWQAASRYAGIRQPWLTKAPAGRLKGGFGRGPDVCAKARLCGDDRKANGSLAKVGAAPANCPVISIFQNDIVKAWGADVRQAPGNVF